MRRLLLLLFLFPPTVGFTQSGRPLMKFGDVTASTFAPTVYELDSSANAVILFDKGVVNFDRARRNLYGFCIVYERHTRIRLLHKNAFGLSTVVLARSIKGTTGMEIENIKGATYNLEDGKVVSTKLDKHDIFQEESGGLLLNKIVFPNVKEGSVIEYTYRIIYPGFGYMPFWEFQGDYPILWSQYDITIPSLLDYITERQGYLPFTVDSSISTTKVLPVSAPGGYYGGPALNGTWTGNAVERIWAIQNVPPLAKREAYITSLRNYTSKIEFQLSAMTFQGIERTFRSTWDQLVEELMRHENFGIPLTDRNRWMTDELKKISGSSAPASPQEIYRYVRDHFDCSNTESIYLTQTLRKTWDEKKGNVADINLLLTALLRNQGFDAEPVILSSRAHGLAFEAYPLLKDYNYVITRINTGDGTYLLDASKNNLGFGQLPELCYNGSGRTVDAGHELIPLNTDSLTETRTTTVILNNTDSLGYSGSFSHTAGTFESMELRTRLKKTKPDEFFENLRKTMPSSKTMDGEGIYFLDNPETPIGWHYNMKYNFTTAKVYLNPVMHERMSINPFSAPERHYPVEMPYCMDYSYVVNMEIPKGYTISELPRSEKVILADTSALFEYIVGHDAERIQFHYRLRIKKTYFSVEEYKGLRDFFAFIIRKEKQQIIFSKK